MYCSSCYEELSKHFNHSGGSSKAKAFGMCTFCFARKDQKRRDSSGRAAINMRGICRAKTKVTGVRRLFG